MAVCLAGVCLLGGAYAGDPQEGEGGPDSLLSRFTPVKPTLQLSYNIAYRFLTLRLKTLGSAIVEATEGVWAKRSGESVYAVKIVIALDSRDDRESANRGRVSIHDRLTIVLTMPELETMVYMKDTDRYLNPLFRKKSVAHYRQLYDLEDAEMIYYHQDLLTGKRTSELKSGGDLRKQAHEVPMLLRLISDIYHGRHEQVTPHSDVRLYVNICGEVTPFAVTTAYEDVAPRCLDGGIRSLRARTTVAPEAKARLRGMVMWSASFRDVAAREGESALLRLSREAPDWNMIPLCCDYDLAVGSTWFDLRNIAVLHEERWASDVVFTMPARPGSGG